MTQPVIRKLVRTLAAESPSRVRLLCTTVADVSTGTAADGSDEVTVTVDGGTQTCTYLDSYLTPAVGDVVEVLIVDGSPLILGRRTGIPNLEDS